MPPTINVPDVPPTAADAVVAPAVTTSQAPPLSWTRVRWRFWMLLVVTVLVSLALYPPPWQALLRMMLTREVARHGSELTIGRIEGGPFDTFRLYDVRCHQRDVRRDTPRQSTDLRIARVELTPDWSLGRRNRVRRSWMQRVGLEGVSGIYDLSSFTGTPGTTETGGGSRGWFGRNQYRFVPADVFVQGSDLLVQRGRYHLRARGMRVAGNQGTAGRLLVRELEIGGPGFQNTFLNRHGETAWQGDRLTVTGLEFAPGVRLVSLALDGAHLGRRHLDWEASLAVLGGEVRAQGGINLSRERRLGLEVAGTMRQLPVQTSARLLGLVGTAGGLVEQGSFSFRGNPEEWSNAEMWLSAQATDFRWGRRRWQNLELQTVVLHRRVQVNRLELRQSRNQLSLKGEFPLPPANGVGEPSFSRRWWEAGFACTVDARLDDLHALGMLVGPRFPALEGRMSINGALEALPGRTGIDGYLNVEGSQLSVRAAPLDYLRSTLVFRGEELQVADLQATHGGDYLTGKWTTRLAGGSHYAGELRVAVKDRSMYAPALDGVVDLGKAGLGSDDPNAPIRLDGTFQGPGPQGEMVFQAAGASAEPLRVPVPTVEDWWKDD